MITHPRSRQAPTVAHRGASFLVAALNVALLTATTVALLAVSAYAAMPAFGYHARTVTGGSMEPSIPLGSVVISRAAPVSDLEVGDVITFRYPTAQASVTHRIIAIREFEGRLWFTTKGDANPAPDPKEVELSAGADKAVTHVPYAGYLILAAGSTSGLLLFLIAPGLALVLGLLVRREFAAGKDPAPDRA